MTPALYSVAIAAAGALLSVGVAWGLLRAQVQRGAEAFEEQRRALADDRASARREMESLRRELIADLQRLREQLTDDLRAMRADARVDAKGVSELAAQLGELRGVVDSLPCRSGHVCKVRD